MLALAAAGVPTEAMTFLYEHMTVDVGHNKLMREYVERLVQTEADFSAVVYAMRVTGHLYGEMLAGAMNSTCVPLIQNHVEFARLNSAVSFSS